MVIQKARHGCVIDTRLNPSPEDIWRMQSYCRQDRMDALEFVLDWPKTWSDWVSGEKKNFQNAFAKSGGSVAGGLGAIFDDARQDLRREVQDPVDRTILSGIFSVGGTVATLPFAIIEMCDRASEHAPAGLAAVGASLVVQTGDGVVSGAGDLAKTVQDWGNGSLSGKSFDDIVYEGGKFGTKGYLFGKVLEGGIKGACSLAKAVEAQPGPPVSPLTPAPVAAVVVPRVFIDAPREWVVRPIVMAEDDVPKGGPSDGGSGKVPPPLGVARGATTWWGSLWQKIGEWWSTPDAFNESVGPRQIALRPDQKQLARLAGKGDVISLKSRPKPLTKAQIVTQIETDLGVKPVKAVWEETYWKEYFQERGIKVRLEDQTGTLHSPGYTIRPSVNCQANYVVFVIEKVRCIFRLDITDGQIAVEFPYEKRFTPAGQRQLFEDTLTVRKIAMRALQERLRGRVSIITREVVLDKLRDSDGNPAPAYIEASSLKGEVAAVPVKIESLTPTDTAALTKWFRHTVGLNR